MTDERSVELVARWQDGDQRAADELFHRYAVQLVSLAGRFLSARLLARVDPEDVVQSAYRSFFAAARAGAFELEQGGDLWRLLVRITINKLRLQVRRNLAHKRAVERDCRLPADEAGGEVLAADGPSPVEALALVDQVEFLMRRLEPVHRRILELRLQGYNLEEIAAQTQRTERTVSRVLERARELLRQAEESPAEPE